MLAFLLVFIALGRMYRQMIKQPETRALLSLAGLVLTVGVIFYTQVEHWTVLNAIYFCVVTLATVGYGDITQRRIWARCLLLSTSLLGWRSSVVSLRLWDA